MARQRTQRHPALGLQRWDSHGERGEPLGPERIRFDALQHTVKVFICQQDPFPGPDTSTFKLIAGRGGHRVDRDAVHTTISNAWLAPAAKKEKRAAAKAQPL